jgi:SpoVK/Ycf46/Vps4 family AAA+-type ATPase
MFENRRGNVVALVISLGGEKVVKTYTRASLRRLRRQIGKIYAQQKKKPYKAPQLGNSDAEFMEYIDNELSIGGDNAN